MDASLVTRLAALSELDLTPEEAESLAQDLQRILRHVEEIAALDLDDVPSDGGTSTRGSLVATALRADEHRPGLAREEALAAAPRAEDGAFRVPGFVDEG